MEYWIKLLFESPMFKLQIYILTMKHVLVRCYREVNNISLHPIALKFGKLARVVARRPSNCFFTKRKVLKMYTLWFVTSCCDVAEVGLYIALRSFLSINALRAAIVFVFASGSSALTGAPTLYFLDVAVATCHIQCTLLS